MNYSQRKRLIIYIFLILMIFIFAVKMFTETNSSSYTIYSVDSAMTSYRLTQSKTKYEALVEWGDQIRNRQVATSCNCSSSSNYLNKFKNGSNGDVVNSNVMNTSCTMKQFPKAILVGMTKGGTTALMDFLKVHPMLASRWQKPKDTRYFNHYYNQKSYEWYRNLMPCSYPHQITVSKSTEYFFTPGVAERIRKFDPSMKILIMVREPIARALSQYVMWKHQAEFRIGNTSFEDAVTTGSKKEIDSDARLIIVSNYQRHMKAWLDNFSLNQILIVDGLNFVKNPVEELNKVENFLGVNRYFTQDSFVYNATKRKYCLSSKYGNVECLEAKKGMTHPVIENHLRIKLQDFFRPRNKMFFNMINRSFNWGY